MATPTETNPTDATAPHATPTVEIQYCVPCGHLPRALDIQKTLLERFGQKIDGVKLKTGDGGVFKIRIGADEIYSKPADFDLEAIVGTIEARL